MPESLRANGTQEIPRPDCRECVACLACVWVSADWWFGEASALGGAVWHVTARKVPNSNDLALVPQPRIAFCSPDIFSKVCER
jgi:hypothetical protein